VDQRAEVAMAAERGTTVDREAIVEPDIDEHQVDTVSFVVPSAVHAGASSVSMFAIFPLDSDSSR